MYYRPNRNDSDAIVKMLIDKYPSTFFNDPKLRRPLKKNILADLQADGFPAAKEMIEAGLDWYQSHFAYLYAIQAGAKRINLHGKDVSTVTEAEYEAAQKKIKEDQQRAKGDATRTLALLRKNGQISDDQVKKLDAPPMAAPKTTVNPELEAVHDAFIAANMTLGTPSSPLRLAMASAALRVMIEEAQRVIDNLGATR
jgi:sRNA-binding protein